MVSVEDVDLGIKTCRHIKPLHKLVRERVRVYLIKQYLQYDKEHKVFLCVGIADTFPKVFILKKGEACFSCSCQEWQGKESAKTRIPDYASCEHEAALYIAFKIGYFKQPHKPIIQPVQTAAKRLPLEVLG